MSTGDPLCDLIAGVYRQAVKDALKGQADAAYFLDATAPDWRQYVAPQAKTREIQRNSHQGQNQ